MSYETAIEQWREGERFVAHVDAGDQRLVGRVEDALVAELRRRLGGAFTVDELVAFYEQDGSWCLELALQIEPERTVAWDARIADAAFSRYVRGAVDFAGGRRLEQKR
ncbi:MAG: hypothetical protein F2813_02070 [Actinobacteria bacterium]|uniref:Unannotated protein n=1 Tax=freshwater metagenome TaxID=449393 RepID=A0A6J5Z988_9ZZZZ|nr:hypothetical protein [Actinomycetota bacterium]